MSSKKNTKEQVSVKIAVLVVSDTRTLANDTSGDLLAQTRCRCGPRTCR